MFDVRHPLQLHKKEYSDKGKLLFADTDSQIEERNFFKDFHKDESKV